jgi:DNA ligase-1
VGVRIDGEWKGRAASTTSPAAVGAQRTVTTFERVCDGRREVVELEARGRELSVRRVTTFGADEALQTALEEAKRAALAEGFSPIGSKSGLASGVVEGAATEVSTGAMDDPRESDAQPSNDSSVVTPSAASVATSSSTRSASDASVAKSSDASKPSSAGVAKSTPTSASEGARRFELEEGSSSKFWEIELDGCDLTTRWGRIGSNGQSKTKTFASPEKARVEHDKLIAEKTGKGYAPA